MSLFGNLFRSTPCDCGCDKLRDELREVRSEFGHTRRQLELEWESTYNKLRSLLARMNKRQEREDAETTEDAGNGRAVARLGSPAAPISHQEPAAFAPSRRRNY